MTLSNKLEGYADCEEEFYFKGQFIMAEDVKGFIKELKDELTSYADVCIDVDSMDLRSKIDELAGDKLI